MNTNRSARFRIAWVTLKTAVGQFLDDDVLTLSGAVTFSTMLSFAPLMLLALWSTSMLGEGAKDALLNQIQGLIGDDGRQTAQAVIDSAANRPALGSAAGVVGLLVALIGATTVFAQLQTSLNDIFKIKARAGNALWAWFRHRIFSVGLLAAIAFVLAVSLVVSAALGVFLKNTGISWDIANQLVSALVFAVLFGGLFRYLPDARISWHQAFAAGLTTAILFAIGKAVIGLYLAHGAVGGAYGAAGSLVVLLVWVYYSSAIFFFGAELVKAWLLEHGAPRHDPFRQMEFVHGQSD
jgi:membrane protein